MTNTIQMCSSSDIIREDTQKKDTIFTSTSVVDIAKFNNEKVIIKYLLPRKSMAKTDWKTMLKNEIENIKKIQQYGDKLVKVLGYIEDIKFERRNNSFPCIITDYYKHGNLQMFIEKNQDLSWKARYEISKQITEGIDILHKNGIYHYDLKVTNILIDDSKKPLIADYGLSVVNDPCRSNGIYSAPLFLSPVQLEELFLGSKNPTPYNEKDDIYSLSYIFYSLAYLKKPWTSEIKDVSDASLICSILFENRRPALKGKVLHPDFEKLICQCWDKNASKRPTLDGIIQILSFLLLPDETFKSEVLNKFDSMPSDRELKIKEQELRKEQENNQKEMERKEMQKKAISKQKIETVEETVVLPPNENNDNKTSEVISMKSSNSSMNEAKIETSKMTPMENFEEEKRLSTKKMDEERKNEQLKKEEEAMNRVLKTKKINDEKANQLKLEKTRKEQNDFLKDQEDKERFKIRDALLKQLELKKEEEAKRRELEKEKLIKQKEEEAFQKIEKAKNIIQEKEKEKLKKEQEERKKLSAKEAELKEKWNIQQQLTKELERKKEEERLKREMEKIKQIKSEEEENFQKTLKAREVEEEKIRKRREEELKKSREQELIIAKQWKIQQEKLREFEKQKEENLLKEKKKKEEEEQKKKEEALNRILVARKKLEQVEKSNNTNTEVENKNSLNFLKNNTDRSAISEFEKKKKEKLLEKEKERVQNIAKDETSVFQKALIAKKKLEEKENQRRKEEQERKEKELLREKEKAEKWKDQKKKFEALEEERRRIREGSVNQDPVLLQFSGRVSPTSSVSSRVNFFRQKIDSESEHGSPQFRCQSPSFRSISPLPTSPQLRSSSPQFYRPNSPQLRASSPTPSNSSISSNSNGQYVYKLRSTNMKDFEKRKLEAQREQERQRREAQKQQEQEAFQKLLNAKKKISEIEAKKKQEELEKKKYNQSGLNNFGRPRATSSSSLSSSSITKEE